MTAATLTPARALAEKLEATAAGLYGDLAELYLADAIGGKVAIAAADARSAALRAAFDVRSAEGMAEAPADARDLLAAADRVDLAHREAAEALDALNRAAVALTAAEKAGARVPLAIAETLDAARDLARGAALAAEAEAADLRATAGEGAAEGIAAIAAGLRATADLAETLAARVAATLTAAPAPDGAPKAAATFAADLAEAFADIADIAAGSLGIAADPEAANLADRSPRALAAIIEGALADAEAAADLADRVAALARGLAYPAAIAAEAANAAKLARGVADAIAKAAETADALADAAE